jgi:hypothetical protein
MNELIYHTNLCTVQSDCIKYNDPAPIPRRVRAHIAVAIPEKLLV